VCFDGFDDRQRRRSTTQPADELGDVAAIPFDFDDGAGAVVADMAGQTQR
jgi:hypothetical protein